MNGELEEKVMFVQKSEFERRMAEIREMPMKKRAAARLDLIGDMDG
jgi:hypothetical protein